MSPDAEVLRRERAQADVDAEARREADRVADAMQVVGSDLLRLGIELRTVRDADHLDRALRRMAQVEIIGDLLDDELGSEARRRVGL